MLLALWQVVHTPFRADLSAFLPAHPQPEQQVLLDQLHSGAAARTLLVGIAGGDAPTRADASRRLAAALRATGLFEQVANGDTESWRDTGAWLLEHRYLLSPAVTPEHWQVEGLREAIGDTLSLLGTPAGSAVKPLLERDPTGEVARLAETLAPARAPRVEEGVWAGRASARALLLLTTHAAGSDLDAQAVAIGALRKDFDALQLPQLQLEVSGAPWFGVDSRQRIEHEAIWLASVGIVAMTLLLGLAFGSLRAIAIAMLPVVSGALAGIAAVGLIFGSVHGLTLGFGSTLIGEAVDYAIYYLIQARDGWRAWRASSWPTVRLGFWTSVCGFAALVFSGFPGLAQLGVFSIAGLAAAVLTTRWVMPVLAPCGASGRGLRDLLGHLCAVLLTATAWLRWPLWLGGALGAAVLVAYGGSAWNADLAALSPVPAAAQQLDADLRADLGSGDARVLVVARGADPQAALRAAEAAGTRLDALAERGVIAGYDSPAHWLPSLDTQRARQQSLPAPAELRERLAAATAGGPLPAARLEPFVAEVDAARRLPLIEPAALAGTALAPLVDALLLHGADGSWSALLPLQSAGSDGAIDAAALRDALAGLPGTQALDIKQQLDALYDGYLDEALRHAVLGAAAVLALLALHLRSWARWFAVVVPLMLAVVFTLTALVLLQVSLGVLHLVGLLLVVAVGSNYALFFDTLQRDPDRDTLASLLLANITAVLSFGLIAVSAIPALSALGQVVAPGACLALLLSAASTRQLRS